MDFACVTNIIHCRLHVCCNLIISWPVTDRRWRTSSLTIARWKGVDRMLSTRIVHAWHDQHTHNWSRFSGVRLWADITFQTLLWEIGALSLSWNKSLQSFIHIHLSWAYHIVMWLIKLVWYNPVYCVGNPTQAAYFKRVLTCPVRMLRMRMAVYQGGSQLTQVTWKMAIKQQVYVRVFMMHVITSKPKWVGWVLHWTTEWHHFYCWWSTNIACKYWFRHFCWGFHCTRIHQSTNTM